MSSKKKAARISNHVKNTKKRNKIAGRRGTKKKRKSSTKKDRIDDRYIEWRKAVYERDDHTCQRCGKKRCYLNAHHIRPWSMFVEDRYDVDNGVALCEKCHKQVHESKRSIFLDLGYGRGKPIPKSKRKRSKIHEEGEEDI
jgi:5-methylcytosine-specific restriction endonuclease McrA